MPMILGQEVTMCTCGHFDCSHEDRVGECQHYDQWWDEIGEWWVGHGCECKKFEEEISAIVRD